MSPRPVLAPGHARGFLHENLLHIGFNMYLLYLLGQMLEPALGSLRFAAIYFTALLAGSLGALLATAAPTLGASGAVFGLMGAAAVELRARGLSVMRVGHRRADPHQPVLSFTSPNISVGAHVGGLIGGALAARLRLGRRSAQSSRSGLRRLRGAGCRCRASPAAIAVAGVAGSGFA